MQLYILLTSLFLVFSSCSDAANTAEQVSVQKDTIISIDTIAEEALTLTGDSIRLADLHLVDTNSTYSSTRATIKTQRKQLAAKKLSADSLSVLFKTALLNKIIPYWEGTPWSFEGHISKPQTGSIACGYFVSTTLQHAGLQLNRYYLAQQSPINEAKSLAIDRNNVQTFAKDTPIENITAIKNYLQEGIHFIGFDQSHVGYILKENNQLYLIHSNYIDNVGVQIEPIEQSEVFLSYSVFHIVPLSTNAVLLEYWVTGKEINIIRE